MAAGRVSPLGRLLGPQLVGKGHSPAGITLELQGDGDVPQKMDKDRLSVVQGLPQAALVLLSSICTGLPSGR